MQTKTLAAAVAFAACAALAGASLAAPASAQTSGQGAAAQPAPLTLNGPAIPGLCYMSDREVIGGSTVGRYYFSRLQQLGQQAQAEYDSQQTQLTTDAKAFEAARATLPADQADQRIAALNVRQRELDRLGALRQKELQATQAQGLQTIGHYIDPIVRQVVVERNCSVLLGDGGVDAVSASMDISPTVVQRLNATVQQFPLDRVHLDESAAAAGPQQ